MSWTGLLIAMGPLAGCSLGYYWQAATGHLELMNQRHPVDEVLVDPDTSSDLRNRLETAQQAVDFAHEALNLPDNGSYRAYADIGRDFVVWNVFGAPEFALEARTWCFPVAGCVSYRGYFAEDRAREFAANLASRGDDVFVGGVSAYSTLGRFEDPLLNTMMDLPDYRLAGLIVHELAHQKVYVQNDSMFNEGFASTVEREGIVRWLVARGDRASLCAYRGYLQRRGEAQQLLEGARERLAVLYASGLDAEDMRGAKALVFAELRTAYEALRQTWPGPPEFDGWFRGDLNNARLAALATYDAYVPGFDELLRQAAGDLPVFYGRVAELAELPAADRAAQMAELGEAKASGWRPAGDTCPEPSALAPRQGTQTG